MRAQYCLVFVDLGQGQGRTPPLLGRIESLARWADAAVLVHDVRATPAAEMAGKCERLQAAGVRGVAIVENFV
jgi:hypothetical protein